MGIKRSQRKRWRWRIIKQIQKLERNDHQKTGKDLLYFTLSTPSKEKQSRTFYGQKQVHSNSFQKSKSQQCCCRGNSYSDTFSLQLGDRPVFFPRFETFFLWPQKNCRRIAENPARKALLSQPRDTAVGFLLNSFVASGFCMYLCIVACFLMRLRRFMALRALT